MIYLIYLALLVMVGELMESVLTRAEIEQLLVSLAAKYNADSIYLFGSYARGEARADSDIDVFVDGGSDFIPADVFAIAEELHLATGKNVDVYEQSEVNFGTPFAESIMRDRLKVA